MNDAAVRYDRDADDAQNGAQRSQEDLIKLYEENYFPVVTQNELLEEFKESSFNARDTEASQSSLLTSDRITIEDENQANGTCGICIDDLIKTGFNPISHQSSSTDGTGYSQVQSNEDMAEEIELVDLEANKEEEKVSSENAPSQ